MTRKVKVFKGLRVLVVDDDSDSRDVVRMVLEHGGAIVSCAESAANALVQCVEAGCVYDVLISDLAMPGRDGLWLVRELKRQAVAQGRPLRAIALTAHAQREVQARAIDAGFDACLTKPFDFEDLSRAVLGIGPQA